MDALVVAFAIAVAACAARQEPGVPAPRYHPNGPTFCDAAGNTIWWQWQQDATRDPLRNVLLVRNGRAVDARSVFRWMPREGRAGFIFAILPGDEPGREVAVYVKHLEDLGRGGTRFDACRSGP